MTLQQMKYAITIAECGSMNEAAHKLYITQPSLSSMIKELEKELGIVLFSRSNRGISITQEGEEFLGYARQIIEQYNLLQDRFVDDARYAAAFAREKSSIAGWGPVKISYALAAKGIDRQVIAAALEERDESASSARMESVLAAKYRTLKDDPQAKLKLLRFALSRGYNYDQIKDTVFPMDVALRDR